MVVIDVVTNRKTSSVKASERVLFRARNCKEICNALTLSLNEDSKTNDMIKLYSAFLSGHLSINLYL